MDAGARRTRSERRPGGPKGGPSEFSVGYSGVAEAVRAISPDDHSRHPAFRSLEGNLASPSWLRSVSYAARLAGAASPPHRVPGRTPKSVAGHQPGHASKLLGAAKAIRVSHQPATDGPQLLACESASPFPSVFDEASAHGPPQEGHRPTSKLADRQTRVSLRTSALRASIPEAAPWACVPSMATDQLVHASREVPSVGPAPSDLASWVRSARQSLADGPCLGHAEAQQQDVDPARALPVTSIARLVVRSGLLEARDASPALVAAVVARSAPFQAWVDLFAIPHARARGEPRAARDDRAPRGRPCPLRRAPSPPCLRGSQARCSSCSAKDSPETQATPSWTIPTDSNLPQPNRLAGDHIASSYQHLMT
jgi:hypothetical protein